MSNENIINKMEKREKKKSTSTEESKIELQMPKAHPTMKWARESVDLKTKDALHYI